MTLKSWKVAESQFPYIVEITNHNLDSRLMLDWCDEQFGDGILPGGGIDYSKEWVYKTYTNCIRFKKQEHCMLFIMRWQ